MSSIGTSLFQAFSKGSIILLFNRKNLHVDYIKAYTNIYTPTFLLIHLLHD